MVNVVVDPAKSFDLIENTRVARNLIRVKREETKWTKAVLNDNENDIVLHVSID
jgi:hypothetical protein